MRAQFEAATKAAPEEETNEASDGLGTGTAPQDEPPPEVWPTTP